MEETTMSVSMTHDDRTPIAHSRTATTAASDPSRQAYRILQLAFVVAPIVAGADKFLNLLTRWDAYLAPVFASLLPLSAGAFMRVVGVVEIIAGVLVAVRPRLGGYVVAAWLVAIIVNLLALGGALDIALRDLGLCLGALALARLAALHDTSGRAGEISR
jgi:hypothetical protein